MYKRKLLAFATPAAIIAALAFATPVAATAATPAPTTTTVAPPVTVTAWDDELTPVVFPAPVVVAVADPPVPPAPAVGVLSSGQLPATGMTGTSWMLGIAGGLVGGGVLVMIMARRRAT